MTDRELLQMALDALVTLQTDIEWQYQSPTRKMLRKVEEALRARLAQPEREWVGLTDEEIHHGFCHVEYETLNDWHKNPEAWCIANARYLEAILKEKNT